MEYEEYDTTVSDESDEQKDNRLPSSNHVQQVHEAPYYDVVQQDMDRINRLSKYLSQLNFQSKVIDFDNERTKENKQESEVFPTEKWNFCNSAPLCKVLSIISCVPICHMSRNKVKYVSKKLQK